jgi:pSer/pThr/pTyr-binding forkhead associated (FHA) protein
MKDSMGTVTDPAAREWAIADRVIQLRQWGTDIAFPLPASAADGQTLGASGECSLRLDDPSGQISRIHARLERTTSGWDVRDLASKNGIQLDGAYRKVAALEPGTELGLGGIILIAESQQLIELRAFLARLLGWGEARRQDVDRALRSVRMAATHRATLVLSGNGELALIAQSLHARVRGRNKPFILCDPRRRRSNGTVRSVANREQVGVALRAALGGSLCFLRHRLPADALDVFDEIREPKVRVQLIVCAQEQEQKRIESFLATPVTIPSLAERAGELDRIISEYANEAAIDLGAAAGIDFTRADHEWVRKFSASSLPDIEKGTRRLVAFRVSRNMSDAATRLRMAPVSLSRWLARRQLPPVLTHSPMELSRAQDAAPPRRRGRPARSAPT